MALPPRPSSSIAAALVLAAVLGACGSSDEATGPVGTTPRPVAVVQDFPAAGGKSLGELQARLPEGPVLTPTVSVLERGTNRVGFGLFDVARKAVAGATAALYVADADGARVRGPYTARSESLAVKPQFESRTTAQDPDSATTVYVADVPFQTAGRVQVMAVARVDGRLLRSDVFTMEVGRKGGRPPAVGEAAPRIHTATVASVGGDATRISTRVPPAEKLLKDDFADVLGRKPVVLVFATPQLCVSRVCGPVVDIAEQVRSGTEEDVAFIHQEIYNDNDTAKGFRPQVGAFRLPSEPWTFVMDRGGRVAARFEGAVSVGELQRAVARVTRPAAAGG